MKVFHWKMCEAKLFIIQGGSQFKTKIPPLRIYRVHLSRSYASLSSYYDKQTS